MSLTILLKIRNGQSMAGRLESEEEGQAILAVLVKCNAGLGKEAGLLHVIAVWIPGTAVRSVSYGNISCLCFVTCGLWSVILVFHPYLVWPTSVESYGRVKPRFPVQMQIYAIFSLVCKDFKAQDYAILVLASLFLSPLHRFLVP